MGKSRFLLALEFRDNSLCQLLAQLDPPLVKRVDVPNRTLCKDTVLVEGDEFTESFGGESLGQNCVRWAVAFENPVRNQPVWCAFRLDLFLRLAEGQCLSLRKHVSQKDVMVTAERIECLIKRYEVARNESRSLMDQLVKRMLAVGSRFTPVNRTGIAGDFASIKCDVFAVALHRQLLEISRESFQVLLVRKDRYGRCAEEVVVPNSQQPHQNRQVAFKGRCAEVLVHLVEAVQHGAEVIR